jgi:hypothetical protein
MNPTGTAPPELLAHWRAAWPEALAAWSKYTRIRDPRLCASTVEAAAEGLDGSFAMIRLLDQSVVVDLEQVHALGLDDYAVEILAHEIGHHVLAPGSAGDQFRLLGRMRRALPTLEEHSAMVANLYTDLHINDRLQRQAGLRIADIYRALAKATPGSTGAVWALYTRIYENLWELAPGSLGGRSKPEGLDADAWLGAKLIRVYASDWMTGAGRFATLLLPYLVTDAKNKKRLRHLTVWLDTRNAAAGCDPAGMQDIDPGEFADAIHPAYDPLVAELDGADDAPPGVDVIVTGAGQTREPFEYGEILKAAGVALTDHDIAVRYYRERALPHLVPFATRPVTQAPEPQYEALEPWDLGAPLDEIDWLASVLASPVPIPGVTLMRRASAAEPAREGAPVAVPVDLDLYVDSSGSMPNSQRQMSYLALAGAVIALSALRAGALVQVTLWSGKGDLRATDGFVDDEDAILRVLTDFFGRATAFPIHRLRETYAGAKRKRPTHILMISDDGISTMFDKDERNKSGWDVAAQALAAAGAGGTMALNLAPDWETAGHRWNAVPYAAIARARDEQGWQIHAITQFEDLLEFARAFSARHYDANAHG